MQSFIRYLRSIPGVGNWIANIVQLAFLNWLPVMSAVIAIAVGAWAWTRDLFLRPDVQVGVGVFVALLWTIIGLTVLRDRRRPRLIRADPDYNYGLTFEALVPNYDPGQPEEGVLQFGIQLRNYSSGPIKYALTVFDMQIEDRALPKLKKEGMTAYLARGAVRTFHNVPFKRSSIREFLDKRVKGTAEIHITYGHPERDPVRRLRLSFSITLALSDGPPPSLGFHAGILEEIDEPISGNGQIVTR